MCTRVSQLHYGRPPPVLCSVGGACVAMEAERGGAQHTPPGSMEKSVEQFVRSVRNSENVTKATITKATGIDANKAPHDAVKKTAKKNKRGKKTTFYCVICNVTVYDAASFEIHLKGKKHQMKASLSKSCEGVEYIHRYEHADENVVFKCELCGVQLLDVVNHLNGSPHILEFLKANKPKVLQNLQLRGLQNISETDLKRIAVTEKYLEEIERYGNSADPVLMERITLDKKIKRDKDCEPPRKKLKMDEPPASVLDQMREKKCGLDQNEKKHSASDERQIQKSDCREYKKSETGSHLKHHGCVSPQKFECNKDLYHFLQYFQISDETDVLFIQQIVKKFKFQLKQFCENTEQEKATLSLNDNKNLERGKLKIAAESILQHADSTTTSYPNESTTYNSADDIEDCCEGTIKTHSSMSKSGTGQPSAMFLDSLFPTNKNKLVPATQPRIAHLNFPPSRLNIHDAYYMTFGGKKNMHISEVIAEVSKFADTKPFLKGIDINQVVQILVQNRTKKNTTASHSSTP